MRIDGAGNTLVTASSGCCGSSAVAARLGVKCGRWQGWSLGARRTAKGEPRASRTNSRGFTLVEALLVITIISLLVSITVPLFGVLRLRAGGAVCISNLRTLHTAFTIYMQDHNGIWPQAPDQEGFESEVLEWRFWNDTMREYGVGKKHWICPTDGDNIKADEQKRYDDFIGSYTVTPFDGNPGTALKWKTPWIIERTGGHSNEGPNMLMSDGTIQQGIPMPAPPH
jgi:prepilin-type N-terminal cleavage/methylation domain-containing protein